MGQIKKYFRGIYENRFVLESLVRQDLQRRYNRSVLGVAWAVITPLGLSIIIGAVYAIIFDTDPKTFIPLLFAGLNPWNFINSAANGGTMAFISAEGYIKQTNVSPQIYPLRVVLVGFVDLLYSVAAFLAVYLFLVPDNFGAGMLLAMPGLLIEFAACVALANISAVINLNFRDYQPLQSLILQGLFYVTPIIYSVDILDQRGYSILYKINPFYYLIDVVRAPLLNNAPPAPSTWIIAAGLAILLLLISIELVMHACRTLALKL